MFLWLVLVVLVLIWVLICREGEWKESISEEILLRHRDVLCPPHGIRIIVVRVINVVIW